MLERTGTAGAREAAHVRPCEPYQIACPAPWNMCDHAHGRSPDPSRIEVLPWPSSTPQGLLDPVVQAARDELDAGGLPGDRILVLRAIWRDLIIGLRAAAERARPGLHAAHHAVRGGGHRTLTVADLGELLGRSPSAASRIATGLEQRGLCRGTEEVADRRQRLLTLTPQGAALLAMFDRARADQFLAVVRPLPMADRAVVAMAVGALASRAMTRRGPAHQGGPRRSSGSIGVRRPIVRVASWHRGGCAAARARATQPTMRST